VSSDLHEESELLFMLRYCVAFVAVCIGGLVLLADLLISLPPRQPGVPRQRIDDQLILVACITFYGVVYTTGRLLYRWWGAHAEAVELHRWSRWHLVILNIAGGGWLIVYGWLAFQNAQVLQPSMIVGVILVGLA
jgi:hypothetical protein